ncbi:FAD-dependent oxidoreductase [Streptomyces sp. NPDC023838]|uniref:FAD-dependent oxidoreductase n=1 Tax=Streptomyces sp. NPDC023838 TaxID=3154325 RepID=UPI00340E995F
MNGTTGTGTGTTTGTTEIADVLVVGAGPTGLLLAGDLAAAGLSVTLIERRSHGTSTMTRAFGVHARTLEQLDARGLADELIATGMKVDRMSLFRRLSLDLNRLRSRFPYLLVTPQYQVEHLLERRAREAGVEFRYETELLGLRQDEDGVTADVRTLRADGPARTAAETGKTEEAGTAETGKADEAGAMETGEGDEAGAVETGKTEEAGPIETGKADEAGAMETGKAEVAGAHGTDAEFSLRAHYLVGADGVRSAVRHALGLPFPGTSVIRSIVLADVKLAEKPGGSLSVAGSDEAFAFVVPFGDGYYRVMGWNRKHQVPDSAPIDLDDVREITRQALGTDYGMHDARWLSRFHSDERQVPRYRTGRIFLAGDAAHVHSPAGGQGLNTGIQDAANLSWKLAAVLRGDTSEPEALLDSYHDERHPVGTAVLRTSGTIVRLAMAHNPLQHTARSLVTRLLNGVRPARDKAMGRISGIGIAYPAPRGTHRLTGTRVPDLALAEGRLYELLREGEFVLVTPDDGQATAALTASAPARRLIRAHWAGDRRTTLLVRPDGYVAWASENPDAAALEEALRRWTGERKSVAAGQA